MRSLRAASVPVRRFTRPQQRHVVGATSAGDTADIVAIRVRPASTLPHVARRHDVFRLAVAAALIGVAAVYLVSLGGIPPGPYNDEASIGYNAWTIAHYGVDQYGNHVPLFFVDFGDYKGPIATYLTVPFVWLFGLTLGAVRAPSVLAGIAVVVVASLLAYRLTRSRGVALATLVLTALQPWLFLQSHTTMEGNVLLMLSVMVACWCAAEAIVRERSGRWWTLAGVALGIGVLSYVIGRLLSLLLASALVATCHRFGRRSMLRLLVPLAAAYAVLLAAALASPAVLFARFQAAGLLSDHPSLLTAAGRFAGNYIAYFNPMFLIVNGDGNARQTTGVGGVILAATLPLIIAGAVRVAMRWREPFARFVILGVVLSPVPAALTAQAPHALRGAGLFPFLVILMIDGLAWVGSLLRTQRVIAGLLTGAVALSATPYFLDVFTDYSARAATAFEAGEDQAIAAAYHEAQGHSLYLSTSLGQPAIHLMFAVAAPPPQETFLAEHRVHVVSDRAELDTAGAGDVLVLGPADQPPPGSRLLFVLRQGVVVRAPAAGGVNDQLYVYVV